MAIYEQSLDVTHISSKLENYEMARNAFFSLQIAPSELTNLYNINYNRDTGGDATEENGNLYNSQKASEYLRLNVTKASLPTFSVEVLDYRRGNNVVHYAGVPTYKDYSITVKDIVGLDTKSLLYSWLYLAYDPKTRKGGRMKDYKKTVTLTEYTQDFVKIRSWTLHGVFVTGIDEDDFDVTADGDRNLTVSLSYDWAEMENVSVATAINPNGV